MPWIEYPRRAAEPRVLIVSQRLVAPVMSRCLLFNFEDVIAAVDAADIAAPVAPDRWGGLRRRTAGRLDRLALGAGRSFLRLDPKPTRRYKLLFVAVQGYRDLLGLGPIADWVAAADVSVCYIEELWRSDLRGRRRELALLRAFDLVLLSCHGSVEAVAAVTGRPCRYLPPAIDMPAFCPYPDPPRRAIDIYAMGRRSGEMHEALLRIAAARGWFYLFDTFVDPRVRDPAEHRRHLADLIKRTRYFVSSWAKFDVLGRTAAQHEVGFRFFEGAAAGAVLLGTAPRTPVFEELFGWADAVVETPALADIGRVIESLEGDPGRVDQIRRANVVNSLRRHDCAYRWADVLRAVGLEPTPALEERRRRLADLARAIEGGEGMAPRSADGAPLA